MNKPYICVYGCGARYRTLPKIIQHYKDKHIGNRDAPQKELRK